MIVFELCVLCEHCMWHHFFFGKEYIISTLQTMLRPSGQTLQDLQALCVIALKNEIVPALSHEGLMPFANQYSYVIPYSRMDKQQITALIKHIQQDIPNHRQLLFAQDHDFYYLKTDAQRQFIDEVSLLYGTIRFMRQALVTSHVNVQGHSYACELEQSEQEWHINCTLFKIINACCLHSQTMQKVNALLQADSATD
jgi:hypothetical protein